VIGAILLQPVTGLRRDRRNRRPPSVRPAGRSLGPLAGAAPGPRSADRAALDGGRAILIPFCRRSAWCAWTGRADVFRAAVLLRWSDVHCEVVSDAGLALRRGSTPSFVVYSPGPTRGIISGRSPVSRLELPPRTASSTLHRRYGNTSASDIPIAARARRDQCPAETAHGLRPPAPSGAGPPPLGSGGFVRVGGRGAWSVLMRGAAPARPVLIADAKPIDGHRPDEGGTGCAPRHRASRGIGAPRPLARLAPGLLGRGGSTTAAKHAPGRSSSPGPIEEGRAGPPNLGGRRRQHGADSRGDARTVTGELVRPGPLVQHAGITADGLSPRLSDRTGNRPCPRRQPDGPPSGSPPPNVIARICGARQGNGSSTFAQWVACAANAGAATTPAREAGLRSASPRTGAVRSARRGHHVNAVAAGSNETSGPAMSPRTDLFPGGPQ